MKCLPVSDSSQIEFVWILAVVVVVVTSFQNFKLSKTPLIPEPWYEIVLKYFKPVIVEANDEMGLDIPEGEYETIAGFFLEQVQSVPKVGTRIRVNNLRLEILEMQGPKITSVRIGKVTKILDIYEHLEK